MGGFDQGWQLGAQRAATVNAQNEAQRIAQRDKQAELVQASIQALPPLPKNTEDPEYAAQLNTRKQLMGQLTGLYQPHEAPSLLQRVSGLIHGHQAVNVAPPPQPVAGAADPPQFAAQPYEPVPVAPAGLTPPPAPTPAANAAPAPSDPPMHPFVSNHPMLTRISQGLGALSDHLNGFAHPMMPAPAGVSDAVARNYQSPVALQQAAVQAKADSKPPKVPNTPLAKLKVDAELRNLGFTGSDDPNVTSEAMEEAERRTANNSHAVRLKSTTIPDGKSSTGFSTLISNEDTGEEVSRVETLPPRGMLPVTRSSTSRDQYGNVTSSSSTTSPQIPGLKRREESSGSDLPAVNASIQSNKGKAGAPSNKAAAAARRAPSVAPQAPGTLTPDGHIPTGKANSQLTEAANQLLDGQDLKELPGKAREGAAALARQYGWEQGTFTPKERIQIREAGSVLQNAMNDPAMGVLDNGVSRYKITKLIENAKGEHGPLAKVVLSSTMTPQEASYVRMYNQLVGTVAGLRGLTQSGRANEATIDRLIKELPNPGETPNSADGKLRLQRLVNELNIAQQKGQFTSLGKATPAAAGGGGKTIVVTAEDMK